MLQEDEIKNSLNLIQQAVLTLDKKIEAQGKRIEQLERQSQILVPQQNVQPEAEPYLPPIFESQQEENQMQNYFTKPAEDSTLPKTTSEKSESLEENIGGKWFARIGIAALILGVSFFLKYAFDNDWIGETGRVIIGIVIGLTLLGIGEKTIRKYFVYGQIITGGGIAVLYLSIFSAFNFYHLIGVYTAFFIMIIITAIGIVLGLRYDALALMTVAIVGGFATPFMVSTGDNRQIELLSYALLLDLAILAVAIFKKWHSINAIGFVGTVILFFSWGQKFYTDNDLGITILFLTLFFIVFSISSLIYNIVKKEKSTGVEQILTLASAFVFFGASYALLNDDYHEIMGFFALVLAIYYFLWAFFVRNFTPEDENLYGFLAFLTVGFITLAIPIQFEGKVITASWIIEAALIMTIGAKLQKAPMVLFSIIVGALALFRYFVFDIGKYDQNTLFLLNGIFLTSVIIIGALYAIAYMVYEFLDEELPGMKKSSLIILFAIAANFITIFSISYEITEYYGREIKTIRTSMDREAVQKKTSLDYSNVPGKSSARYNSKDYYSSNDYKLAQEKIEKLESRSSIILSIFWLIYSIILLAIGIVSKNKGVRLGGLALLILAIFKLFFIDLWSLGTLYRIISSISLGAVLLAVSFVYQKNKNYIKEII